MIFRNETYGARVRRLMIWHAWFAWYPVQIGQHRVWLEWVKRRATETSFEDHGGIVWEYER